MTHALAFDPTGPIHTATLPTLPSCNRARRPNRLRAVADTARGRFLAGLSAKRRADFQELADWEARLDAVLDEPAKTWDGATWLSRDDFAAEIAARLDRDTESVASFWDHLRAADLRGARGPDSTSLSPLAGEGRGEGKPPEATSRRPSSTRAPDGFRRRRPHSCRAADIHEGSLAGPVRVRPPAVVGPEEVPHA